MKLLKYVAMFGLTVSFAGLLACSGDVAGTTEDENTVYAQNDPLGVGGDSSDANQLTSAGSETSSSSSAVPVISSGTEGKNGNLDVDSISSGGEIYFVSSSSSSQVENSSGSVEPADPAEPTQSNWVFGAWTADTNKADDVVGAAVRCIAGGPFGETVVPVVDNGVHNFGGDGAVTSSGTVDATYFDSVSDTLFSERVKKLVGDGVAQAEAEKQVVAEFYSLIHADEMEALTQTKVENYVVKRLAGYVLNSISRYTWVQNKSEFVRDGDIQDSTVCTWAYLPTLSLAAEAIPKLLPANCSVEKDDAEALQKLLVFAWAACRELPVCDASSEGTEVRVESVVMGAETVICKDFSWTVKTAGTN